MGAPAVASRALRVVSPHAPHRITKLVRHYKNQENRGNVPALAPAALARGAVGEVELLCSRSANAQARFKAQVLPLRPHEGPVTGVIEFFNARMMSFHQ